MTCPNIRELSTIIRNDKTNFAIDVGPRWQECMRLDLIRENKRYERKNE